jgi:hypothetical protein
MVSWVVRGKQPDVQQVVRFGIDRGVQPVRLVIHLNDVFIERNLGRCGGAHWSKISFLDPVMNRSPAAFDTVFLKFSFSIRK